MMLSMKTQANTSRSLKTDQSTFIIILYKPHCGKDFVNSLCISERVIKIIEIVRVKNGFILVRTKENCNVWAWS